MNVNDDIQFMNRSQVRKRRFGMIRLNTRTVAHYLVLYVMLLIPGSCAVAKYLNANMVFMAVLALHALLMLLSPRFRGVYVLFIESLLLITIMFVRARTGGAGITSWLRFAAILSITYIAVRMDKQMFLTRFIRIVVVFALISNIFWVIFCISPNLVNTWPATTFWTQDMGTGKWAVSLHGKGLWLYSYLEVHPTRNCGFYTEPGVYQIVLNAALIVLLFWRNKLRDITSRQYYLYLAVVLITILTCQSTTGYISMAIILAFYLAKVQHGRESSKIKLGLVIGVAAVIIAAIVDYSWRGTESVLYQQVIYKFFGDSGETSLNLSEGTGRARIGTIEVSLQAILQDPLGVGTDQFEIMKNTHDRALVAGSFFSFAAQYGIFPWITLLSLLLYPLVTRETLMFTTIIALVFINTTLAQTYILFPGLIMFSIYLTSESRDNISKILHNKIKDIDNERI